MSSDSVLVVGRDRAREAVTVLAEAFFDYPVMRYVLRDADDYTKRLHEMVNVNVMSRLLCDEFVLGIDGDDGLVAAATVSIPGETKAVPSELAALREALWTALGPEADARYKHFSSAADPFVPDTKHIHLNMIGVRNTHKGRGLGRAMMDAVHALAESRPEWDGVSLSTEVPGNVPMYEHFGYEVVGETSVKGAFSTWGMYRKRSR